MRNVRSKRPFLFFEATVRRNRSFVSNVRSKRPFLFFEARFIKTDVHVCFDASPIQNAKEVRSLKPGFSKIETGPFWQTTLMSEWPVQKLKTGRLNGTFLANVLDVRTVISKIETGLCLSRFL